jgi:hypothetical protein
MYESKPFRLLSESSLHDSRVHHKTGSITLHIHKDMCKVIRVHAWWTVLFEARSPKLLVPREVEHDRVAAQSVHSLTLRDVHRSMFVLGGLAPEQRYIQASLSLLFRVVVCCDAHFQEQTSLSFWLKYSFC